MKTIIKPSVWKILELFYDNHNAPLHLREISRRTKLNESGVSRYLNQLLIKKILLSFREGNLKKFNINSEFVPILFPLYDFDRLENLPLLRKNAIKLYLSKIKNPAFVLVFGSTAKGNFGKNSDLDVLEVTNSKADNNDAEKYVKAQTSISVQSFRMLEKDFRQEMILKKDKVIQAALDTGFPVSNNFYFYKEFYHG